MSPVAFITGVAGQDGAYLAEFLLKKNYQVVGLTTTDANDHLWRLELLGINKKVTLVVGSLLDKNLLAEILQRYQPQGIYNLAGQSSVALSWEKPSETLETNSLGVAVLLEQIRLHCPNAKLFQAGSSEMYGDTASKITEKLKIFNPLHPYGSAKLAAYQLIKNFRQQYNLFACTGILFNHESPLREDRFVSKIIAKGVAKIAAGQSDSLELGNTKVQRDFGFAGDFVEAMWLMLQNKQPEDFVICSGQSVPIIDFVKEAFQAVGLKDWKRYIKINPSLVRKQDVKHMRGSYKYINRKLGWKPRTTLTELVKQMVEFERKKL